MRWLFYLLNWKQFKMHWQRTHEISWLSNFLESSHIFRTVALMIKGK